MSATFFGSVPETLDRDALAKIAEEIIEVEGELQRQVGSQVNLVRKVGEHTLNAGGKRLRPALVTLAAAATGLPYDPNRTRKLGACMELIHMATLIHDDVIDKADLRRGRPTAASVFGNTSSILSGDVLLAKSMRILAEDGDLDIIRNVSKVVVDLAEGEVMELELRGRLDLTEEEHREVLRMKTATFIEVCLEVGATCAGANPAVRQALRTYGFHIGVAFQIVDDLLDYRGDHVATGKQHATDFREGCATLPLIFLMPSLNEQESALVRDRFGNGVTESELQTISQWMNDRGAFGRAAAAADDHVRQAKAALDAIPASPERTLLETVADYIVSRKA